MRSTIIVLTVVILAAAMGLADALVPPSVIFVEIGNDSRVYRNTPVLVDLKLVATDSFTGTLELVLAVTDDPEWSPVNVINLSRAIVEFSLEPGQIRQLPVTFPVALRPLPNAPQMALEWQLHDTEGTVLVEGREPLRAGDDHLSWRSIETLFVSEGLEGVEHSISPSQAFTGVTRYDPFSHVVIGLSDFASLSDDRRQALLDATAMSMVLVLCDGPEGGSDGIEPLEDHGELIWRSGTGQELRETRLTAGIIRRLNLSVAGLSATRGPLQTLVFARQTLETTLTPFENPELVQEPDSETFNPGPANEADPSTVWARAVQSRLILGWTLVLVFLVAVILWALRLSARNSTESPSVILRFCCLTIAVPFVMTLLFSKLPAGNLDHAADLIYTGHDQRRSIVLSDRVVGGGGGSSDPWIYFGVTDRVKVFFRTFGVIPFVLTRFPDHYPSRFELDRVYCSAEKILASQKMEATDAQPWWDADLHWTDGRGLTGHLEALQDLLQVVLFAGSRTVRLGNVAAGTSLDLTELTKTLTKDAHIVLTSSEYTMIDDVNGLKWMLALGRLRHSRWLDDLGIVGIAAGSAGNSNQTHPQIVLQSVRIQLTDSAESRLRSTAVPWSAAGQEFQIWVPEILARRFEASDPVKMVSVDWVGQGVERDLIGLWNKRFDNQPPPPPDERSEGFFKYILHPGFDWNLEETEGHVLLVWNQAGLS